MLWTVLFNVTVLSWFFRSAMSLPWSLTLVAVAAVALLDVFFYRLLCFVRKREPRYLDPPRWKNVRRALIRGGGFCAIFLAIKACWFWLLFPGASGFSDQAEKNDLFARRSYLLSKVSSPSFGPGDSPSFMTPIMQVEWAIVSLSMTSAALTSLAYQYPDTRPEALTAIRRMIERMLQKDIRDFETFWWKEDALDTLDGRNGHAGYLGHLNWMLAAYRLLGGGDEYTELNRRISTALARRLDESPSPCIETFPGMIFVPDVAAAVASVALSSRLENGRYDNTVRNWLAFVKDQLVDSQTGILRPWVSKTGRAFGPVRGSYAAWNVFFIAWIDPDLAQQQYGQIKKHLASGGPLEFAALREYLPGISRPGDVDSGPVVFGLSTSGTGFVLSGARRAGDWDFYAGLLRTAEAAGFSMDSGAGRRYLLAPLVGDAIMLAMRTSTEWDLRFLSGGNSHAH